MKKKKHIKIGKDSFVAIFRSQAPVNKVIISLGTNDLQRKYNKEYKDIISDLIWYKEIIENMYQDENDRKKYFIDAKMPDFIYVLPINFDYQVNASDIFDESREKERKDILKEFSDYVEDVKVVVLNDMPLFNDGIHLNYKGHKKFAEKIIEVLK